MNTNMNINTEEEESIYKQVEGSKWYALRVVSGKEKKALKNLIFELNIKGYDKYVSDILLPMRKEYKLKNGKKVSMEKLTFPGYLLFSANLNAELERIVKKTNFIIEFMSDNGKASPLKQKEVDRIIGRMEEAKDEKFVPFVVGEIVSIIDGPFTTFKGEITDINKEKETLKVNVSIFGRVTPVDLNYLQVDKNN